MGILQTAFADGTFGAFGEIQPPAATTFQSYATYYAEATGNFVQVVQVAVENSNPVNPVVFVEFSTPLSSGTVNVGIEQADEAQFVVVDLNFNTSQVECVHAVGVGTLEVTAGDVTAHDGLAFVSDVSGLEVFHPTNIYGQDVSGQLSWATCDPM